MGRTPEQARSSRNFDIISQKLSFVKSFFQAFSNFVSFLLFFRRSLKRLHILAHALAFVNTFFQLFSKKIQGARRLPDTIYHMITLHPQSSHSRRHCAYRPLRMHRCYPHHGKRRSCAPAGSSAGQLPHGSWDGSRIP